METTQLPPEFDVWSQPITLLRQDGSNTTIDMAALTSYALMGTQYAANYGGQIGASVILLLVLLLLTRREKRKSWIFMINAACLGCNVIRGILLCCYLTGSLFHPMVQLVGDLSHVMSTDLAVATAENVFMLIETILVMISLSVQVWVVCVTTAPVQRYIIMGATSIMALMAIGYAAAFIILNIQQTLRLENMMSYLHVISISKVTQAVSIWLYSCAFTWKLGLAIIQRRRLKMTQFGPMQIVFIMGCQTMIIPALITTLAFIPSLNLDLQPLVLTVVAIFLPLSAIWAGVANDSSIAGSGPNSHHRLINGEFYRSTSGSSHIRSVVGSEIRSDSGYSAYGGGGEKGRNGSVCMACARQWGGEGFRLGVESVVTMAPRKRSVLDKDVIHVASEFGFERDDGGVGEKL